jgi:hypothetical protein
LLAAGQVAVTTYHYDNNRTGWNKHETVLTPANVGTSSFGWLRTVVLDDQVDAQPLVVPGVLITAGRFQGAQDVVYVATEHNTVYAIDVHCGTVLLSRNLGPPVPLPSGCMNIGPNVGVNSTPKNQATLDQFDADFGSGGVPSSGGGERAGVRGQQPAIADLWADWYKE